MAGHAYAVVERRYAHGKDKQKKMQMGTNIEPGLTSGKSNVCSILLEGTSYLRQMSDTAQKNLAACMTLEVQEDEVEKMKRVGFRVGNKKENGSQLMYMNMHPSDLVQLVEASDVLASNMKSARQQIPFIPHGKAMREGLSTSSTEDKEDTFYQYMFVKGENIIAEQQSESLAAKASAAMGLTFRCKDTFGTKFIGYTDRSDTVKHIACSGKPYNEEEQKLIKEFIQARNRVMFMPLIDHKTILSGLDKVWEPIEFPKPLKVTTPQGTELTLSPAETMKKYINITVAVPYDTTEQRKQASEEAQVLVDNFNANAVRTGVKHVARQWCCMNSVVRTVSLCLEDVKDIHINSK